MSKEINTLVLSRFRPDRLAGGAALRNWQNIQGLAKLGPVDVVSLGDEDGENPATDLDGVRDWKHFEMAALADSGNARRSGSWVLEPGTHPSISRYEKKAVVDWIEGRLSSFDYDYAVIEELSLARYIPIFRKAGVRVIFDAHNVEATLRAEMAKASDQDDVPLRKRLRSWLLARRLMEEERRAVTQSEVVWACSDLDASIIRREYGKLASTVPNGVNVDTYQDTEFEASAEDWESQALTLVFLGSYSYFPNEEAALTLIEQVMPLVRQRNPDARLVLIGRDPTGRMLELAKNDESIVVTGGVPSVMPYLKAPGIVTIPLTLGSGTRLKILEAFAAGVPVVSTPKGAEGLDVTDRSELRICETPAEMAEASIALWNDRAAREAQCANALKLVCDGYSLPVAARRIAASLSPETKADAWFIPFMEENPYQAKLAAGLGEQGFKIGDRPEGMSGLVGETLKSPRVIHLHWLPRFKPGLIGLPRAIEYVVRLRILKLIGAPIVWTIHNLYHHEAKAPKRDRWVYRQVMACVTKAIAHSEAAKNAAIGEFNPADASKIEVVPHGHYIGAYSNRIGRSEAREQLGLSPDSVSFLFLGMIRPYKGILELLETYRSIGSGDTELVIAGRPLDDETERLVRKAAEGRKDIKLRLGFVPDDEIQTYMNACDAVVFPYRDVLTSGAVVLAMSFGKACIAPRLGCLPEMVGEGGGFLYDADSSRGLAEALGKAVASRDNLDSMGKYNFERASEWGWDRIAGETADLYRAALDSEESRESRPAPSSAAVGREGTI